MLGETSVPDKTSATRLTCPALRATSFAPSVSSLYRCLNLSRIKLSNMASGNDHRKKCVLAGWGDCQQMTPRHHQSSAVPKRKIPRGRRSQAGLRRRILAAAACPPASSPMAPPPSHLFLHHVPCFSDCLRVWCLGGGVLVCDL